MKKSTFVISLGTGLGLGLTLGKVIGTPATIMVSFVAGTALSYINERYIKLF